ncbi:ThiF family adenylyltransferase, partial [Candidatus Woesearchaeota archaeon]|nr:ThiF family adenylyltransferase [Candidatus Woesearchaeota archaeon]
ALAREDFDLRLIDRGRVEEEDMGRLNIFQEEDITKFKVKQAKKRLELINPRVKIKSFHEELSSNNVFLIDSELVIDATNQPEVNKLIFDHCQEKKIPLIYVRYSGSRIKVLVANKKITQKDFDWLEDVGNVSEEGVYAGCAMFGAMILINRIYKFFLGDTGSFRLEADSWEGDFKRTKI